MNLPLVVLFVCLFAVEAARNGDYSGARMPYYGIEYENKDSVPSVDEYLDRSPDASASFDYKNEEAAPGKMKTENQEDTWQNTKKRKIMLKEIDDRVDIDENEDDIIPKKSNYRFHKHRTRIKDIRKGNNRRDYLLDQSHNDDFDGNNQIEYKINKNRPRDDNGIDLEGIDFRYTTKKVPRRKPRDRTISHEVLDIDDLNQDQIDLKRNDRDEYAAEREYEKRPLQATEERPHVPFKTNHKVFQEYDGYYDMKRVNNNKNRLPGVSRQTKASSSTTEGPSMRWMQDITYRRANLPEKNVEVKVITDLVSTETKTSTPIVMVTRTASILEEPTSTTSTELSLAEKSRLSILKKVQKKENVGNTTRTTKPPVLMQVTKQMQTLVMVEPGKQDLHFRAQEVFYDSPERISRAKKLMRRKLVAGARRIEDIIDNWDEMVCDYIDVSLLNGFGVDDVPSNFILMSLSVINRLISKAFV